MRVNRFTAIAAVAVAAGLVLSGCSSSTKPSTNAAKTDLAIAVSSTPPSLDPTALDLGQSAYIWQSVYDTLLYTSNSGVIEPNAAKSWKYSSDAKTLTLNLRSGMKFSNGDKVTAEDVKATMVRSQKAAGATAPSLASVSSIDTPDETELVLHLSAPDPTLLANLSSRAGIIADPKTFSTNLSVNPIGSGAYVLDKSKTTAGATYVLDRRPDYWNVGKYPFKTITVKVIADTTAAFNALQAGEVDWGYASQPQEAQLKSAGFSVKELNGSAIANLVLADRAGTVLKPLSNLKVRQAINMAFDRAKIVAKVNEGVGSATEQLFGPGTPGYDASLNKTYSFNVTKAKKLMAEAGYANGFSVTMPSFVYTTTWQPTISQSLADIGIKVTWQSVPLQSLGQAIASKQYPMIFFLNGININAVDLQGIVEEHGFLNPYGSSDSTLTKLVAESTTTTDPAAAAKVYKKISAFLTDQAWIAPLFYTGAITATAKRYKYLATGANGILTVRVFAPSN